MGATAAMPMPAPAAATAARSTALTTPWLDFLLAGGLSLIVMAGIQLWLPLQGESTSAAVAPVSTLFWWLAFLVNWPHFLITYQILYWNNRDQVLKRPRFIWAGIVAPALMIAALIAIAVLRIPQGFGYLLNLMFLLVGWHFVKQSYGVAVVLSAKAGWYLKPMERRIARTAMYALWVLSFASSNVGTNGWYYHTIFYTSVGLPGWTLPAAYVAVAVTGAALVGMVIRKARVEGHTPPLNAMVAILAIYVWFIPMAVHPIFFYMIAFFHALQYLLFAVTLTVNRAKAHRAEGRSRSWTPLAVYLLSTIVLGAIFSTLLPWGLDYAFAGYDAELFGTEFWVFAFTWFINLHHYLIDNRIWLSDSPGVRQYL